MKLKPQALAICLAAGLLIECTPSFAQAPAVQVEWPRANLPAHASSGPKSDAETEARAAALLARMTLDEKIGQMIQAEIKSASPEDVRTYHLGSVLNGGGSTPNGDLRAKLSDWARLADRYYEASMTPANGGTAIPVLWGVDAVHGHNNVFGAVLFPHNIGLGAANDPELTLNIGEAVARDVRSSGLNWAFAPTLAVVHDARWGRAYEGFSQDPSVVRRLGGAFVQGLQGKPSSPDWLNAPHTLATAKHYIGDGGTTDGVDQGDAQVTEADLRDIHAAGYYGALEAGVQTVMVSFSSWNGQKMHQQRYLITEILKGRMGFDGLVVSDWNAIGQTPGCSVSDCPAAINAGIDMVMAPTDWKALYGNLLREARSGEIPMARIDDAVKRILRVKIRAGLFEAGKPSEFKPPLTPAQVAQERELARKAVEESLVLLKNQGRLLPLSRQANVLVTGDGADSLPRQSGGWSLTWQGSETSNADFPGGQTIFQGIKRLVEAGGGVATLSQDGAFAKKPDVAIVVFGETPYAEGQGDVRDLGWSLHHPETLAAIKRLKAAGVPVVAVLLSGRPLWTNPEINAADAFVAAFLPGTEGEGVADLLFAPGKGEQGLDFKGKLSFAWPSTAAPPQGAEGVQFPVGYGLTLKSGEEGPRDLPEDPKILVGQDLSQTVFYRRGAISPWRLLVGDPQGWQTSTSAGRSLSASQILSVERVDHRVQEDAIHAVWNGQGLAQVYLQSVGGTDWSALLKDRQALTFSLRMHQRPSAPVFMRQDCLYPCGAKADVTRLMNAVPLEKWVRISIDERCFVKAGLRPSKVDTPFLIATSGKLDLDFSYVDLEPVGSSPPTVQCD